MTEIDGALTALAEFASALDASQAFLFDGEGFPFLALRVPLTHDDVAALELGLDLLIDEERRRPPPFTVGQRPEIVAAALGIENLYVVALVARSIAGEARCSVALPSFAEKIARRSPQLLAEAAAQKPRLGLVPFARRAGEA